MATPKQFRRRGRWFLIFGTLLAAMALVGVALATTSSTKSVGTSFDPNGTYSSIAGTNLHQTPPISNTSLTPDCSASELAALPPGGVLWHFVLTQTTDEKTGSLRADFQTAGLTVPDVHFFQDPSGNPQWNIITPTADTLLNASTDALGDQLNLSHVCYVPVTKGSPHISTDASGTGVTGDALSDTAHLTGGFTPPSGSGGSVTFTLYGPGDTTCSTVLYTDVVAVTWAADGTAEVSSTDNGTPIDGNVALTTGTYQWIASYGGNDQNDAAGPTLCNDPREANVVTQSTPTAATEIHFSPETSPDPTPVTGSVDLGTTVHDSATVTPASDLLPTPTGKVTFSFYSGTCADSEHATLIGSPDDVTLVNGAADPSANQGPLGAGSYFFLAHYTPDPASEGTYTGGDSTCEPLTVNKAQLTIVTQIHNAAHGNVGDATHVPLGSVVHDTATVTGTVPGFNPTGAITFTLGGNLVSQINPAELGFTATTVDSAPLGAGSYLYRASVAGDPNYIGDRSGPEPLTVDKGTLSIVTKIHDASHAVVTFVPVNGIVHDTAHITGANSNFPVDTSKVSFTFYNTIDCTGTGADAGNNGGALDSGDPRSDASAALASGAYSYNAAFAGDDNYNPITAANVACEPLSVRTFGKTMGYWGNRNGQARIPANFTYTLGAVSNTTCSLAVTKARTLIILPGPGGGNGISLLTNCTSRDSGIQNGSMNTLLSQALALELNIAFIGGFNGQTVGSMGLTSSLPTAFPTGQSLTANSTVQQVLDYANYLIANAKLNNGVTITQTQIGQLNTFLGLINSEA